MHHLVIFAKHPPTGRGRVHTTKMHKFRTQKHRWTEAHTGAVNDKHKFRWCPERRLVRSSNCKRPPTGRRATMFNIVHFIHPLLELPQALLIISQARCSRRFPKGLKDRAVYKLVSLKTAHVKFHGAQRLSRHQIVAQIVRRIGS